MNIIACTDRRVWESFIKDVHPYAYFQAWEWGDIEKAEGRKVWRVCSTNEQVMGICQIVKIEARRGTFLHLRHGPVLRDWNNVGVFDAIISFAKEIARKENASFIRISPLLDPAMSAFFQEHGFRKAPVHTMDAELVSVIDLSKTDDELLRNMRKTTRNLIRRGIKDGVTVEESNDIQTCMSLYRKTSERHDFVPHTAITAEFEEYRKRGAAELLIASYQSRHLAAAIVIDYNGQSMYRHGASIPSKIPAAYVLQWEAMLRAKKRGMREYNLYGIADTDSTTHPWWGLTVFKKGFGGTTRQYLHAHDLPLTMLYWLTYAIEAVRTWKRGY